MIRRVISRLSTNAPWLFYRLKTIDLAAHYFLKKQFEPDFKIFRRIAREDNSWCIVDVGANIGQSAIGFSNIFPSCEILSFEANPDLEAYLAFCRRIIGARFAYQMMGLSVAPRKLLLYIPRRGKVYIYGEATVDVNALFDPEVERRIGRFDIVERVVQLVDFDSLKRKPDIVKIDVQGHELAVLHGMHETIKMCSPILLIERSQAEIDIKTFLEKFGYRIFLPSFDGGALVPYSTEVNTVNMFALPVGCPDRASLVKLLLMEASLKGGD